MRLFRRRNDDAAPDPEGPALGAPTEPDAAEDGVAREPKQPTGDWMTLPPLAPTFRSMPTTFRVQTLPEILPSHHDTRLSGSLGHAVSPDAPSGSVAGLASRPADGLTHAGEISRAGGLGELPLREPHHEPAPEPVMEVRRLADPTPISTSSTPISSPPATLPAPTVSRSLLDTAPLVARPASEPPLPVARVVDAPAATSAPAADAPAASSPSPSLAAEPAPADDARLTGEDDRVGGFGVGADDFGIGGFTPPVDDVPRIAAPPELAPPIQPRRIQRSLDANPPANRPSAAPAPSSDPSAPLVGDATPGTSVDPVVPPVPGASTTSGELPLVNRAPAAAPADLPVSRLAEFGGASNASSAPSASDPGMPDATPAPSGGGASGTGAASVSRLADATPSPGTPPVAPLAGDRPIASQDGDAAPAGDAEPAPRSELPLFRATATSPDGSPAPVEPPIQRLSENAAPTAAPSAETSTPTEHADATLLGDSPLPTPAADAAADGGSEETAPGATPELPLVNPRRADDDTGSIEDAPPAATPSSPTLGAGAEPMVSVQPRSDSAAPTTNAAPGTAGLPLAPSDLGPTLTPPQRPAPDVQRLPEASSATRPLASPAPSAAAAGAPSVQRLAAPSAGSASSTTTLPLVRPIGAGSSGLQGSAAGAAPMSLQTPAPSATNPSSDLPVQLRRLGAPDVGDGVTTAASLSAPAAAPTGTATLPLAGVQRLDSSSPASPSFSGRADAPAAPPAPSGTSELPLHTPAASIPSAADIAVRAGLAERGPDGSLFTTAAPAATSFTVQREPDGGSLSDHGGGGAAEVSGTTVLQREVTMGGHRAASAAGAQAARPQAVVANPAGGGGSEGGSDKDSAAENKSLAAEAKKLYPFIRSALEADIRRQLEGKSRASRYRP